MTDSAPIATSRRDFLRLVGAGAVTLGMGGTLSAGDPPRPAPGPVGDPATPAAAGPYNILFILTDQERFFRPGELPAGYRLPGHERLMARGTTFQNHRINSCVCTPSRSVIYCGRHIQQTRMFDNTNFPWVGDLGPDVRTVGHLLRDAGYYTAYKGKWHLTKAFEMVNELGSPTKIFTKEMEAYGFSDYMGIGDIIAHHRGGYLHDGVTAAMAQSWLRGKGRDLAAEGKPWFMAVNLVNPHDVMFYDTDPAGTDKPTPRGLSPLARDPKDPLYATQWDFALPANHAHPLDAPGRPRTHRDFLASHDAMVGAVKDEEARWHRRHNYYLNCLRDADRNIVAVLDELEAAGLADRTIIVLTADHGDMDGAHKLHAKGGLLYREQNQVPLIVAHPGLPGGRTCSALTTHVDLAPTLVGFTGVDEARRKAIVGALPGRDLMPALAQGPAAKVNAVRSASLFNYNMFAYIDGDFLIKAVAHLQAGGKPNELKQAGILPDLGKRGAMRSVFDGRYAFARYFSPRRHHRPETLEQLLAGNDLELFDTQADPLEMDNLAQDPRRHGDLILAMNAKLNALIDTEVGDDNGQMLPGGAEAGWEVSAETMVP